MRRFDKQPTGLRNKGVHQKIFIVAADADSFGRDERTRRSPSVKQAVCQSGARHKQEVAATAPNH